MKKLSLIGMGLVLLMAMTQCKKAETPSTNENEGEKVHITLEVDNGSKNFIHPETGNAFFTNGDKVFVANNGHYVGTLTYNSSNRHFDGSITGANGSDYLHFYFLGNQPLSEGALSVNTRTFTVNIIDQTNCYPQIAYAPSSVPYSASVTAYKACLLNKCALVEFTTNGIPVETVVTVSGLNNRVSVNLGSNEFTFSKVGDGNIKLHAESAASRWAILLPQEDITGVTANAEGYEEASVTFTVPAIGNNDYLTDGATMTLTETTSIDPSTPLTLEALTDGTIVVDMPYCDLEYGMKFSVNGGEKTTIKRTTTINVNAGDKVQFYGNGTSTLVYGESCNWDYGGSVMFVGDAQMRAYGNIMSLIDETGYETATTLPNLSYVFRELFKDNIRLTDASGLLLPATTLANSCYSSMFYGCTSLTKAPALPATTLAYNCYNRMFYGCTSLTTAPALPATTLANSCYAGMFYGCTSLTAAPLLLTTTLADDCYSAMFYGCTSLTKAPALPAPELPDGCYFKMFYGCTNLSSITCLATSRIGYNSNIGQWVKGVASIGTFTKASGVPVGSGTNCWIMNNDSGIPSGWTVNEQ